MSREPRPMTERQKAALDRLERAFGAASKAGLVVCGMDSQLIAYRRDDLDWLYEENDKDLYEAQRQLNNEFGTAVDIRTSGVYRESGGW